MLKKKNNYRSFTLVSVSEKTANVHMLKTFQMNNSSISNMASKSCFYISGLSYVGSNEIFIFHAIFFTSFVVTYVGM